MPLRETDRPLATGRVNNDFDDPFKKNKEPNMVSLGVHLRQGQSTWSLGRVQFLAVPTTLCTHFQAGSSHALDVSPTGLPALAQHL